MRKFELKLNKGFLKILVDQQSTLETYQKITYSTPDQASSWLILKLNLKQ